MSDEQGLAKIERDAFIAGYLAADGETGWPVAENDHERAVAAWDRYTQDGRLVAPAD